MATTSSAEYTKAYNAAYARAIAINPNNPVAARNVASSVANAAVGPNTALTNPSSSDAGTSARLVKPPILGEPNTKDPFISSNTGGGAFVGYRNPRYKRPPHGGSGAGSAEFAATDPRRLDIDKGPVRDLGNIPPGGEPQVAPPVQQANIQSVDGDGIVITTQQDLRVKIRVPTDYLTYLTSGSWDNELQNLGGIIFPYTPQISYEHKANYSSSTPTHSNYAVNFYKHSMVEDINIQGKFTVQNDKDAMVYLSTIHLLRSLTKMRYGNNIAGAAGGGRGSSGNLTIDSDSGAPPPICRLNAYGDFMFKNVPVAIVSFKNDLPDGVDYYTLDKKGGSANSFGQAFVPTLSTIQITCKVMYSRREMLTASVTDYLNSTLARARGIL